MPRRKKTIASLALKITPPQQPGESLSDAGKRWAIDTFERFDTLSDHYQLPRTQDGALDFLRLALSLAIEFIPGFRPATPRRTKNRSRVEKVVEDMNLLLAFANAKGSINSRAINIAKQSEEFKGKNAESLRKRFVRLRDPTTPEGRRALELLRRLAKK